MKISALAWDDFSSFEKRLVITYLRYLRMRCVYMKPPICFATRTALLGAALVSIFPMEPMTIPAVLGSSLSINLIVISLSRAWEAYHG